MAFALLFKDVQATKFYKEINVFVYKDTPVIQMEFVLLLQDAQQIKFYQEINAFVSMDM